MSVSLTGDDVIIIKERQLADLADGDVVVLDTPNNIAEGKRGKNGNVIIAYNATGKVITATIRVLKGSSDDKFLNREFNTYINNRVGYIMMTAEFIKKVGDGAGNITSEIYTMSAGFVTKFPGSKENVEGDTEQGVSIYEIQFMNTDRALV